MWAGEIQFQSIQLNNSSVSISYVDADGVKTFTCEEQPREEFRTAMAAMSFTPTDNVLRIMKKIYDEAALYISGERREQNLFKTSRGGEQESSHERANEE